MLSKIELLADHSPREKIEFRLSENNNLKETIGDIVAILYL